MSTSQEAQSVPAFKMRQLIRTAGAHLPPGLPPFLILTDPERTPEPDALARGLPPGCGLIYRHFGARDAEKVARHLAEVCRAQSLVFLIGNDPQLALAVQADGVHWPERRLKDAARWRSRLRLMTAAAHSAPAIRRARRAGTDAVLVSPVFPSRSKSAGAPIGSARFRSLARSTALPVYGLGGVNLVNARRIAPFAGLSGIDLGEKLTPRT
ncbi:MAG: thiamine phosphate synthase [Pseudomonadota bacterium]